MGIIPSFTVEMDIYDVLYLSYLVPVERLRPAVPRGLSFALTSEDKTVLSLVLFRSRNVKPSFLPFIHFAYDQVNVRAYVLDPVTGKPGVFFLRSGITSRLVSAATSLLGIPWRPVSMSIDAEYAAPALTRYTVEGLWVEGFNIRLGEKRGHSGSGLFETAEEAARFITGPAVGFYGLPEGLIRFEVRHSVVMPLEGEISGIEFPLLVSLGLLGKEELKSPLHALVAPHAHFTVFMPPAKIALQG